MVMGYFIRGLESTVHRLVACDHFYRHTETATPMDTDSTLTNTPWPIQPVSLQIMKAFARANGWPTDIDKIVEAARRELAECEDERARDGLVRKQPQGDQSG